MTITGLDPLMISDTICDPTCVEALPPLSVDEPTVSMEFSVNNSPFCGKDGKYLTSRQIRDRLDEELKHNVALRVDDTENPDTFKVSGRGELHLAVLIETMRREGYELAVSRPQVIRKEIDGEMKEPYEQLTCDVEDQHQGAVMEALGTRKADLQDMVPDGKGRVRLDYIVPARGMIGFQMDFMSMTSGSGLMTHVFDHYGPIKSGTEKIGQRRNGAMISMVTGKIAGFSLFSLQERGKLFMSHGEDVYEGMVIGIHSRDNDLVVNPIKGKQLTNVRASGTDENIVLTTPINCTLEYALGFIDDDELVEVTPINVRVRKRHLTENDRKRAKSGNKS